MMLVLLVKLCVQAAFRRLKTCTKCQTPKTLPSFSRDRTRPDGKFPWCRTCISEDNKKRYQKDPQKVRDAVAARKEANPEAVRSSNARYYRNNKVSRAAHGRRWVRANPERRRAIVHRYHVTHREYGRLKASARRAKIRGLQVAPLSETDIAARVAVYGGLCAYCRLRPYEHLDHVKPIRLNGPHILANLRPACALCNKKKGGMPAMRWLRSLTCSTK